MRKLAYSAFSFAGGILVAAYFLPVERLLLPGILLAAGGGACLLIKKKKCMLAARVLMGFAVGLLWFLGFYQARYSPAIRLAGTQAKIKAVAIEYSKSTAYGSSVVARLREEGLPRTKLMIWLDDEVPQLRPGDTLELRVKLEQASSPGEQLAEYYPGIGVFLIARQDGGLKLTQARRIPLRYAHLYIAHAGSQILPKLFPAETEGIMAALVLGDKRLLNSEPSFVYALQRSGLSHTVAVSGMHVSFLVGLILMLVNKRRSMASLLSLPAILLFMGITGFTPGVVRAGIMQLFIIAAFEINRQADPLTSLAAALTVLLAINPFSVKSVSLQLSFASTLGLLLFSGKLQKTLSDFTPAARMLKSKGKLIKYAKLPIRSIIGIISATLSAMVFTVPLAALYFGSVSLAAPISNLVALWSVWLAFCSGIVAVVLGAVWLPLGKIAAIPAVFAAGYFKQAASAIGSFGLSAVETGGVYLKIWLFAAYGIFLFWYIMKGPIKRLYLPLSLCAALLSICLILSWTAAGDMSVAALDVGQGSCTVLTGGRTAIVVDCGGNAVKNAGALAAAYLRENGFERIDALIFTHTHSDHANGAQVLLSQMDVSCVILPDSADEYSLDVKSFIGSSTELIMTDTDMDLTAGDMLLKIFGPVGDGSNEDGLSVVCSYGSFDTVLTGDMSSGGEERLTRALLLPDAELLIVGHHGSKYSTSEEFLQTIRPEIAIISVGRNNYGHPTNEVLTRLTACGAKTLRTDENGTVVIRIRGDD